MKRYNFNLFVLVLALSFSFKGIAQQVVKSSEAISLALEYNYGIQIANNNIEVADIDL